MKVVPSRVLASVTAAAAASAPPLPPLARRRSALRRRLPAALGALALAVFFLQVERGLGDIGLSLSYVAHDLLACAGLAFALFAWIRRPWTASIAAVSVVVTIWAASTLKIRAIAMPLLASDLQRLFDSTHVVLDFGGPVLAGLGACAALVWGASRREAPVPMPLARRAALLALAAATLATGATVHARIPYDMSTVGPRAPRIAVFLHSLYRSADFDPARVDAIDGGWIGRGGPAPRLAHADPRPPHVVVILEESTFPPENLAGGPPMRDRMLDGAAPLRVTAVGGGTWIEEYSLLHGVEPTVYGRDHPQVLTLGPELGLEGRLAPALAAAGYRTTALIPYDGGTLGSRRMLESLGFAEVADCPRIPGCAATGGWSAVPDSLLFDDVLRRLRDADEPVFVYAPTIRQHSPHVTRYPLSAHRDEILAEYLRRHRQSAAELEAFLDALRTLPRRTVVLAFGDHIPADVNAAFDDGHFRAPRQQTFFNLWDSGGPGAGASELARHGGVTAPSTAYLDALLLRFAGFEGDYVDRKLAMMRGCGGTFCARPRPEPRLAAR